MAKEQAAENKYPIGGYAPGNYTCKCTTCGEQFRGDKRAVQCEPCAVKMTTKEEAPQVVGFNLLKNDLEKILGKCLKPEEIGGKGRVRLERIDELIRWFLRFADGNANPKWLRSHAFELVYYIATSAAQQVFTREQVLLAYYDGFNQSHYSHMHPDRFPTKECESAGKEYMNTNYPPSI